MTPHGPAILANADATQAGAYAAKASKVGPSLGVWNGVWSLCLIPYESNAECINRK